MLIFFFLVFSDEILMPQDSPPIMQTSIYVNWLFAGFLISLCPKRALVRSIAGYGTVHQD